MIALFIVDSCPDMRVNHNSCVMSREILWNVLSD
jgi:hypothetical protein